MTSEEFQRLNVEYSFHESEGLYHHSIVLKMQDLGGVRPESIEEFLENVLTEKAIKLMNSEDFQKFYAAGKKKGFDAPAMSRYIQTILLIDSEIVKKAVDIAIFTEKIK